jgi:hypothetical protein
MDAFAGFELKASGYFSGSGSSLTDADIHAPGC